MTRYLKISGLCFSLAAIVYLLGFAAAFAQEPADQTTVDTVQSSEKLEQPKMNEHQIEPIPEPVEGKTVKGSKSNADNRQIQPDPEPVEATTVKSSKSNSSERQIEPIPEPVEGKTVKGSKSNTSE